MVLTIVQLVVQNRQTIVVVEINSAKNVDKQKML